MQKPAALLALAALAQDTRLETYRLLMQAGAKGIAAGEIAAELDIAPNALSFHLDRLLHARLISVRRNGRSLVYAARRDTMAALIGYLAETSSGASDRRAGALRRPSSQASQRRKGAAS